MGVNLGEINIKNITKGIELSKNRAVCLEQQLRLYGEHRAVWRMVLVQVLVFKLNLKYMVIYGQSGG